MIDKFSSIRTGSLSLIFAILLFTACQTKTPDGSGKGKPNILFLLADDLGYGELGSYGQEVIETPVLDRLATQGMRFTDFYAGNAVCSPSRAVLMTGKSSTRNTIRGNTGSFNDDRWLRVALTKDEITLGEMLQTAGYQTGFVGKWHLDDPNDLSTWAYKRGFDFAVQEQWSSRFGGLNFPVNKEGKMWYMNGLADSLFYENGKWSCMDEYRTKIAIDYLDTIRTNQPFFLFMSYRAPHAHERKIYDEELYADQGWPEKERIHAAKITLLDREIGKLLKKLEDMGKLDNTLIIFSSDNGPHGERTHNHEFFNSNGDLKGFKRDLYEGGIRVPLIVYWKGKIEAGVVSNRIAGFQDIMPTLAEVAGMPTPDQSDGISILPLLTGKPQNTHGSLSWEFQLDGWWQKLPEGGFRQSARIGNWKGVRYGVSSEIELYDLGNDISEEENIANKHPEIVEKMNQLFTKESHTPTDGFPYGGVVQDYLARDKHQK